MLSQWRFTFITATGMLLYLLSMSKLAQRVHVELLNVYKARTFYISPSFVHAVQHSCSEPLITYASNLSAD